MTGEHMPGCHVSAGTKLVMLFPGNLQLLGSSTILRMIDISCNALEHLNRQLTGPGAAHTSTCDAIAQGCQTRTHTKFDIYPAERNVPDVYRYLTCICDIHGSSLGQSTGKCHHSALMQTSTSSHIHCNSPYIVI